MATKDQSTNEPFSEVGRDRWDRRDFLITSTHTTARPAVTPYLPLHPFVHFVGQSDFPGDRLIPWALPIP